MLCSSHTHITTYYKPVISRIWSFPKSWGYPQFSSILVWDFPWNKPSSVFGVPPFMETPWTPHIYPSYQWNTWEPFLHHGTRALGFSSLSHVWFPEAVFPDCLFVHLICWIHTVSFLGLFFPTIESNFWFSPWFWWNGTVFFPCFFPLFVWVPALSWLNRVKPQWIVKGGFKTYVFAILMDTHVRLC